MQKGEGHILTMPLNQISLAGTMAVDVGVDVGADVAAELRLTVDAVMVPRLCRDRAPLPSVHMG